MVSFIKVKSKTTHILFVLVILSSCAGNTLRENIKEENPCISTLEKSEKDFKDLGNGLYEDKDGEVYFRTLDVSAADNRDCPEQGLVYSYNKYLYVDSIVNGVEELTTPRIVEIIDVPTFQELEEDDSTGTRFFKDKDHRYFLIPKASGGTLHLSW